MHTSQISTVTEPVIVTNHYTDIPKDSYLENQLITINKLVGFGQPILLLCTKIIQGYRPQNTFDLKITLANELQIFTEKCQNINLQNTNISIAKYVLVNTLQDIFIDKDIEFDTTVHKQLLSEPFNELLQELLKAPKENIELLELIFICYKFGFRDNYLIDHHVAFDHIEQIYNAIRETNGGISKKLYSPTLKISNSKNPASKKKNNYKFLLLITIVSLLIVIISNVLLIQNLTLLNTHIKTGLTNITKAYEHG